MNSNSSVDTVMGYALHGQDSNPSRVKKRVYFTASGPILVPTQPHIQRVPGIKELWREANSSPLSSAEFRNAGAIHPVPYAPIRLHGIALVS
jgi:hypothetical protein